MKISTILIFNTIIFLVLYFFLYFFLTNLKTDDKRRKLISVTFVISVVLLTVFSIYSGVILQKKRKSFKVIKPVIIGVKDISGFEAKKYLINIVVPPGLKKTEIKDVLLDTNKYIRSKKKASVIWVAVYNKALPKEELSVGKNTPYFVAMGRWVRSDYNGLLGQIEFKSSESYKGMEIFWNI